MGEIGELAKSALLETKIKHWLWKYQCSSCHDCRPGPSRDSLLLAYRRFPFTFWIFLLIHLQTDKDQRALLYERIRGCETSSKVVWLLWVAPVYLFVTNLVDLLGFSHRMEINSSILSTTLQSDVFCQARMLRLLNNTHSQLLWIVAF